MPAETSTDAGLREVENIENIWIPMQDGVRLAARLWLPDGADGDPVPALLEYIPYRKRDHTRLEDEKIHPHLAAHGYACVRVDIRGAGDSEGRPQGEYVKQEQDDCLEVIDWLSKQAWCSGRVGMFGYSWGGFSALQVAMRRPPALKAIITHCSTDDRYTDGDQWMGGCIEETFFMWGIAATLIGARPPDPAIVGERWREMWMERLAGLDFHVGDWLDHQRKDDFWRHASVSEDYSAIECAVYAVGGWADHFNNTVARMLRTLSCPCKGLVGPWNHALPNLSTLGPTMDWLSEALRWWDFWLKDKDTGIMDEPVYRVGMQDEPAFRGKREVAGRWVAEQTWPSPRIVPTTYHLTGTGLERRVGEPVRRRLRPRQTVGITAPTRYYRPDGVDTGLPTDQQADDARSLVFDTQSLPEDVEIVGAPVVKITLSSNRPVAFLAVRLNELQPDGVSKRVSFGVLNLTHRHGDDQPQALVPGEPISVRVQLHECAHSFSFFYSLRI